MITHTRFRTTGWVVTAGLVVVALAAPASTLATKGNPDHKVTICHRTDSQTNPYVQLTVDVASVDGIAGNDHGQGDHLLEHQGDVWYPGHVKTPQWGDIIPSQFSDGTPDGLSSLNWTAAGQAIFNNGCSAVTTPNQPNGSASADPSTSPSQSVQSQDPSSSPSGTATPFDPSTSPAGQPSSSPSTQPTSTPVGHVLGATGAPQVTPPPTDVATTPRVTADIGWQLVLIAMAGVLGGLATLTPAVARKRR